MTKKAYQLKVGDKTKRYGVIKSIDIHTTGEAIHIVGTEDTATLWKNTLVELENSKKENEVGKTLRHNDLYGGTQEKINRGKLKYSSNKTNATDCVDCEGTGKDKEGKKCRECDGTGYSMSS